MFTLHLQSKWLLVCVCMSHLHAVIFECQKYTHNVHTMRKQHSKIKFRYMYMTTIGITLHVKVWLTGQHFKCFWCGKQVVYGKYVHQKCNGFKYNSIWISHTSDQELGNWTQKQVGIFDKAWILLVNRPLHPPKLKERCFCHIFRGRWGQTPISNIHHPNWLHTHFQHMPITQEDRSTTFASWHNVWLSISIAEVSICMQKHVCKFNEMIPKVVCDIDLHSLQLWVAK